MTYCMTLSAMVAHIRPGVSQTTPATPETVRRPSAASVGQGYASTSSPSMPFTQTRTVPGPQPFAQPVGSTPGLLPFAQPVWATPVPQSFTAGIAQPVGSMPEQSQFAGSQPVGSLPGNLAYAQQVGAMPAQNVTPPL